MMPGDRTLLVVGAHAADFVWRSAGVIATVTEGGGRAVVVALSYGERGESGELWKEPNQTVENVKKVRHEQAAAAAEEVGATYQCLDLGDYPLEVGSGALARLADIIRESKPDAIVTHTEIDPFNPDHGLAATVTQRARLLATGAGVPSAFGTIRPPALYYFEPHQPELCGFVPTTYVDITAVFSKKQRAMEQMLSQQYLVGYYTQLAERRANHARKVSGNKNIRYAEAFQRVLPQVVTEL